jgi:hypothetical protein
MKLAKCAQACGFIGLMLAAGLLQPLVAGPGWAEEKPAAAAASQGAGGKN